MSYNFPAWQLGILFSAFFWTYTALQFVMGWVVDRFEVNLVIAAGFLVWSLATAATGLVHGFLLLLLMRLIARHRRVRGLSLVLENSGAPRSRTKPWICQRRRQRGNEVGSRGGHAQEAGC